MESYTKADKDEDFPSYYIEMHLLLYGSTFVATDARAVTGFR